MPVFFIPHGGGPCFFMDDPDHTWTGLGTWLRGMLGGLDRRPRAIVVISSHWETREATVNAGAAPGLIFDYQGFPPQTYELRYDAPGSPELAARIVELLREHGIAAECDTQRGYDHGVFVPFLLVAPEADIPIVQLSLVAGLDPAQHLAIGMALAPLRSEDVLIVGSGMSYHNLRAFFQSGEAAGARDFDAWLTAAVTADSETRRARLRDWEHAPGARQAHPREEHLLPLHVVAGAAGDDTGTHVFGERIMGAEISGYRFG